ncbi:MAG: ABC transporter ATP-binding protein [Shewanellaceae bacterium]|nr:ABC transporter ATP-binding protein [Shewanellaceae bacterium]
MSIIRLQAASLAFGHVPLLDKADLVIQPKERVCLVGRNGAGKSSLMKVLAGELEVDAGEVKQGQHLKIARLQQDPPRDQDQSIYDFIASGLAEVGTLLSQYQQTTAALATDSDPALLDRMMHLQQQIETLDGWRLDQKIHQVSQKLELDPQQSMQTLSGGWLRKAALAKALITEPDLLLLDEPTNHLDIDTIEWLENFLLDFNGALVFISHDRQFIRRLATRILDLDRGHITSWPGNFEQYLQDKQAWLEVQAAQQAEFDKKLAQEEVWIRQGIKARRTRNEGRVRALKALRQERRERIETVGQVQIKEQSVQRSGKLVLEAKHLSQSFGDTVIATDFNLRLLRGDRVAFIGPNGCGKSTLIQMLLGQRTSDAGNVRLGTNLEVAYFDQHRAALDETKTVAENVGEGKQHVMVQGKERHILSYLQDFLFAPERARSAVSTLSGGEKNRLLLAKLLLKSVNVLVLDEPTNDLDMDTLSLLENWLVEYQGTLLLVSHDRQFIDETVTSSLWYQGDGQWHEYVGGYQDAVDQGAVFYQVGTTPKIKKTATTKPAAPLAPTKKKLSYRLQRELDALPEQIQVIEEAIVNLQAQSTAPDFYKREQAEVQAVLQQLQQQEQALESLFERWTELESML